METISKDVLEKDISWLAGIIEGEGWIGIYNNKARRHRQFKVAVANTDPFLLRRVSEIVCSLGINFYWGLAKPKMTRVSGSRVKYQLTIEISGNRNVLKILKIIFQYLYSTKKEIAKLMIEYLEWRTNFPEKGNLLKQVNLEQMQLALKERLSLIRNRQYSLQRLPRRSSQPLDISNLQLENELVG